nr:MAG TPA: hypothetical protein [Caudoviricetes sp.]
MPDFELNDPPAARRGSFFYIRNILEVCFGNCEDYQ